MRIILTIIALTWPVVASAQLSKLSNILANAEEMVRDVENNRVDLRGDVQVVFKSQHLYSERATIDMNTKMVQASGRVSIITPKMSIEGDQIHMNYETGTGTIYNGFVRSGNVTFEGEIIRKVGDQDFEVENGQYTACKTCPPAWSFSGKRIRAELGGYAYITQPIFKIASYPFFWLPYLVVPLKSKRQSGFLFPSIDFSQTGGTAFGESYFWAIDPHRDATFTLKRYSKRGWKGLVNHRFYMDQESYGEADAAFLDDKVFPSSSRLFGLSNQESIERWFLKYRHHYELPGGFAQRTQFNLVSDLQYLQDFPEEMEGRGQPALENRVSLTKNTEDWHTSLEAAYYENLLKTNAKTDNDDAVHRFPEIHVSLAEKEVAKSGLLFRFDGSYVNFARDDFGWDDITFDPTEPDGITKRLANRDGQFNFDGTNTRDQIRAGQRTILKPKLSYPIHLSPAFDVLTSVTWQDSFYQFGFGDDTSARRSLLRSDVSIRSNLSRVFGDSGQTETRYKHEIIPEIGFTTVPVLNQSDHPFFGEEKSLPNFLSDQPISDDDFFGDNGLQFDYFDRVLDRRVMSFSMTNKLTRRNWNKGVVNYNQIGLLRLTQNYDFEQANNTQSDTGPWSDFEALLELRFQNFETNTVINYFPDHNVTNISSRVRFRPVRYGYLQTIYTKTFIISEDDEVDRTSRTENLGLSAYISTKYFNLLGGFSFNLVKSEINSWFYNIEAKPPGECWGILFSQRQVTGGEVKFSLNFSYSFDGRTQVKVGVPGS